MKGCVMFQTTFCCIFRARSTCVRRFHITSNAWNCYTENDWHLQLDNAISHTLYAHDDSDPDCCICPLKYRRLLTELWKRSDTLHGTYSSLLNILSSETQRVRTEMTCVAPTLLLLSAVRMPSQALQTPSGVDTSVAMRHWCDAVFKGAF